MKKTADIIIIGAGIIGAATGYYLAKNKLKVLILEKQFPCAGSTGRCIGGIRQQYTHPLSINVMLESVRIFSVLKNEFGKEVEWYSGGYLFLAHSEDKKQTYLQAIDIQKQYQIPVRFITPDDCLQIVKGLNPEGLLGGAYCPTDGQANPFAVTYGYLDGIKKMGGKLLTNTEVAKINVTGNKIISAVTTDNQEYFAPVILNAAGPWAKKIGKMVNLDIPVQPERHESVVTEACERLFDPMLVDYRSDGCYFIQNYGTGHFIGCYTPVPNDPGENIKATSEFLTEMPRRMARLVPRLGNLKVIRQWAGSYEMTPDGNPIVDKTPVEGFYVSVGMCGHGFMFGPALGKYMAELITQGKSSLPLDDFALNRSFGKKEAMK
ncbi:MAG: FAD-binding oxidoreductase [Candidatus Latescibacteria bacterium]|nr:FAD-binding oxidoreductase [Candidatus Latescibacterota bacterium]